MDLRKDYVYDDQNFTFQRRNYFINKNKYHLKGCLYDNFDYFLLIAVLKIQ